MKSQFDQNRRTQDWVQRFYTQAGIWWGTDPQAPGTHEERVQWIRQFCGPGTRRILDLGAGPGRTMAAMARAGHTVVGVEFNSTDAKAARYILAGERTDSITYLEDNFYTVVLDGKFDVVTCWQAFGFGSDDDQRLLLHRIAYEWLAPHGSVLLDVYNPSGPARDDGQQWQLAPLAGVAGSVEMIEKCTYDPIHGRWIDEWQPTEKPEDALAQSIRCYTPADLQLLLEGSGLCIKHLEFDHQPINLAEAYSVMQRGWFRKDYNYLVQLVHGE